MSYMTSMYAIMNKAKWNAISPADQKAIEKINEEYVEKFGKLWVELDNNADDVRQRKGRDVSSRFPKKMRRQQPKR